MRRYTYRLRKLRALICRHKTTSLVVREGFEMQEDLRLICVKCRTTLPLEKERGITITKGKLHYHRKPIHQLSCIEKREFNTYIKILKHMTPLTISTQLAQKLIESSKVKDFEIRFTSDLGKNLKISKFQFTTEGLPLSTYLESLQINEAKISFSTRDKTMTYKLLLEEQAKASAV